MKPTSSDQNASCSAPAKPSSSRSSPSASPAPWTGSGSGIMPSARRSASGLGLTTCQPPDVTSTTE